MWTINNAYLTKLYSIIRYYYSFLVDYSSILNSLSESILLKMCKLEKLSLLYLSLHFFYTNTKQIINYFQNENK